MAPYNHAVHCAPIVERDYSDFGCRGVARILLTGKGQNEGLGTVVPQRSQGAKARDKSRKYD